MEKTTITGGQYRGRKISTPGGKTHPMGSREKLALFNMLGEKIKGAKILDAFAGSGALGIEALSRGAFFATFIDKDTKAIRIIEENLIALGINDKAMVVKGSLLLGVEKMGNFDIILADPPYDDFKEVDFDSFGDHLIEGGILVLSHPGEAPEIDGLELLKTRAYAAAHLSVYTKN